MVTLLVSLFSMQAHRTSSSFKTDPSKLIHGKTTIREHVQVSLQCSKPAEQRLITDSNHEFKLHWAEKWRNRQMEAIWLVSHDVSGRKAERFIFGYAVVVHPDQVTQIN